MKKTAALMSVLLLSAAMPVLAQTQQLDPDEEGAEGRPHLNLGPDRELTQACRAEATQRNLVGKERRHYVRECQKREVPSSGPSGMGMTTTSNRILTPMPDAEGRYLPQNVTPSHFAREGPSTYSARPAIPDVDAEGRPRPH